MVMAVVQYICRSLITCRSHTASWVAKHSAMYSDSEVDRATVGCFLLVQLVAPPDITNTFPEVDRRSSESKAQSASEEPSTSTPVSWYCRRSLAVPFKYRKTRLTPVKCVSVVVELNLGIITKINHADFNRVSITLWKKETFAHIDI